MTVENIKTMDYFSALDAVIYDLFIPLISMLYPYKKAILIHSHKLGKTTWPNFLMTYGQLKPQAVSCTHSFFVYIYEQIDNS